MMMIDPAKGWFEMFEVITFDLNEVTGVNDEYIYNSYSRASQLFNITWICIYLHPRKVSFDSVYEFKQ